jgi:hypothetical protein
MAHSGDAGNFPSTETLAGILKNAQYCDVGPCGEEIIENIRDSHGIIWRL